MIKTVQTKRGRKSSQEISQQVSEALKHLQELEYLEESPLGRLSAVRQLAETSYRSSIFPTAFALRSALLNAAQSVINDLTKIPGYQREVQFLQAYIQGQTVTEISISIGLSREHVARTIQPRTLGFVTRAFLTRMNANEFSDSPGCSRDGKESNYLPE